MKKKILGSIEQMSSDYESISAMKGLKLQEDARMRIRLNQNQHLHQDKS